MGPRLRCLAALAAGVGVLLSAGCDTEGLTGVLQDEVDRLLAPVGPDVRPTVISDFEDPRPWPMDGWSLEGYLLEGDTLTLEISYGGGCAEHLFALLAVTPFMESFPVQLQLRLAHDDRDDPCDALIHTTLRYDLTPIRDAYREAYPGLGGGGESGTVILRLQDESIRYDF